MNNRQRKHQPSVDDMLASIRKAIHGTSASVAGAPSPVFRPSVTAPSSASRSASERIAPTRKRQPRSTALSAREKTNFNNLRQQIRKMDPLAGAAAENKKMVRANGFAGILSGDVRLEEALAKLQNAGLGDAPAPDQTAFEDQERGNGLRGSQDATIADPDPELTYEDAENYDDLDFVEDDVEASQGTVDYSEGDRGETEASFQQPGQQEQSLDSLADLKVRLETDIGEHDRFGDMLPAVEPLTSDESSKAVSSAFNRLAETIVGRASGGNQSIEDLTRDLLRPMLKSWLDENLPDLVEKLLRDEIERVARYGGKP